MFSLPVRHLTARLLCALPVLVLASCGGNDIGALITVPNSVVVADLRGIGVMDIAVASAQIDETGLTQKPGLLDIILNTKATPGTFLPGVEYATSAAPPSGLAVGDLTGNGSHDMVVANFNTGTITVFMETTPTSGTYPTAGTTITVGGNPNDVQIADLNGDGLPDLIVADNAGVVTYLLQNAAAPGTFLPGVSLPVANRGISVAVGDLNGDGFPDLAVTSFDAAGDNGLVTIYFQDPSNRGTFLPTPQTITALGEPSQIRIADVNQDGSPDLVIACQGLGVDADSTAAAGSTALAESLSGAMVILQNSGAAGTFGTPIVYPAAFGSLSLAVGDLNMDGLPDIALVSAAYIQGEGTVSVLLQDASAPGTFAASSNSTITGSGQPVSIVIADMNNDGLPDLVTADSVSAVWYANQASNPGNLFAPQGAVGL